MADPPPPPPPTAPPLAATPPPSNLPRTPSATPARRVPRRGMVLGATLVVFLLVAGLYATSLTHEAVRLSPTASATEPAGWERYPNSPWEADGAPVLFLYGSLACPYC